MQNNFIFLKPEVTIHHELIFVLIAVFVVGYFVRYGETIYSFFFNRPLFVHFYLRKLKLNADQKRHLKDHFFYKRLTKKKQAFFDHRVSKFLSNITYISREDVIVDEQLKIEIAIIPVMLTFGMRSWHIDFLNKIVVYPQAFYSTINKNYHKGEFNPGLKTLVLSLEDFKKGNVYPSDGINLGIHEFTHAIHFSANKNRDISSLIFYDTFLKIQDLLREKAYADRLEQSELLRPYAFINDFEFIAVVIEVFIESPRKLQGQFPEIYDRVREMLNFRFAGY